jgi:hypothetical protein
MASKLEKTGHIASIVMCLCVAAAAVQFVVMSAAPPPAAKPGRVEIQPGTFVRLPEEGRGDGAATLLLAVSPKCRFCTDSMPFYKKLTALPEVQNGRLRLSLLTLQNPDDVRAYAADHGVSIAEAMPVAGSGLSIAATPTLVLVGPDSKVRESWVGYLNEAQEGAVQQAAQALARQ